MTQDHASYANFAEGHIKHLDMIQAVIARLAGNGFAVKGWTITIVGALLGLSVNGHDAGLAFVTLVPITAFWLLDGYLLWAERCFRALYSAVRDSDTAVPPFTMAATSSTVIQKCSAGGNKIDTWTATMFRPAPAVFYVGLGAAAAVVGILVG